MTSVKKIMMFGAMMGFASGARSRLGSALRRFPLAGELVVRAAVMAAVVIVVSLTLQFLLYWQRYHLDWLTPLWLTVTLPRVVLIGFGFSLVVGVVTETRRLIGGATRRKPLFGIVVVVQSQADVFEVVDTLCACRGLPDFLDSRHEQSDQDSNDGNHDEQFDQRECTEFFA